MAEGLVLFHLLSGADGDVVAVRILRNIVVCKITVDPTVPCSDGTKDEDRGESCDPLSPESELESWLDRPGKCARFTPLNNFFILQNTCNNNSQQEVPSTLGVSVSIMQTSGRKQKVV
jgi:hypothetical protein